MPQRSHEALQAEIAKKGHDWKAGPTSVSHLSANEQKARLGLAVEPAELEATASAVSAANDLMKLRAIETPAAVDWRNNGGDWITPIRDQGDCGSCVAHGTLATLEARLNIVCKNPNLDKDLSEAQLFFCGCGNCCDTGWNFAPALDFVKNTGVCEEASFPYTPVNQPCKPGLVPYVKITAWTSVLAVADRKNVIATKGPVVGGFAVFADFFSYTSGVYRHTSGDLRGYHAISVVGYDDAAGCWICKNSWGAGWGDAGFFRIGYGECLIDTQFAAYDIDVTCPAPTVDCRRYIPYLQRVLRSARLDPRLRACLRYYVCRIGMRPRCTAAQLRVVKIVLMILRRCPQYRRPFCRALG
jgi:C1A family cysteine protease